MTFNHKNILIFYIVYEINIWPLNLGRKFPLLNFLFGTVTLTKSADPDKYSYYGYGIGFDTRGAFSLSDGNGFGKNVIVLGVDNRSSVNADKRKKYILVLGKDPTDRLDDTA